MRYVPAPRINPASLFLNRINKKAMRRVVLGVLLAFVVLLPLASYASASLYVRRRYPSPTEGRSPFWSWNFESGTQWSNSGPLAQYACGNNPGQVVTTLAHGGTHSGYYVCTNMSGPGASFPSLDYVDYSTGTPRPSLMTRDVYAVVWIYIPSQTLVNGAWFAFGGIETYNFNLHEWDIGWGIDSGADRKFLIWYGDLWQEKAVYQGANGIQWPFDRWFSLAFEVHLRTTDQLSTMIAYQDGVQILRMDVNTGPVYTTDPPTINTFHWGLYAGSGQKNFEIYNDDILLYDLT